MARYSVSIFGGIAWSMDHLGVFQEGKWRGGNIRMMRIGENLAPTYRMGGFNFLGDVRWDGIGCA